MNLNELSKIVDGANPYLAEAVLSGVRYMGKQIRVADTLNQFRIRQKLTRKYAWAIPTPEALKTIRKYAPLIEIGAGKGYWASLLDVDIICFDCHAKNPEVNSYVDEGEAYYKVFRGGADRVAEHPERTLFLCWPPYDTPMAADCLRDYRGKYLVFIGEWSGGCTADGEFWKMIKEGWEEHEELELPQWYGINDWLMIFKRKS